MWPFRKKPKPPVVVDRRENGNGWREGDLAECIADNWIEGTGDDPKTGEIYRVSAIQDAVNHRNIRCIFLWFEGMRDGYNTQDFRKIVLTHDANEVEEGIIAKIKRAAKQGANA